MQSHVPGRRQLLAAAGALALAPATRAAPGGLPNADHGDSSPEWEKLRARLFSTPPLQGQGVVQLIVPLRAAYGASVPIKVVSKLPRGGTLYVRHMWLLIDKNPSPLAMDLSLTPDIGQADFETRVRVDEYSHVRVVFELSDGSLHTDSRYVKTSGGCSAPPNRDAPHLIGKTLVKMPGPLKLEEPNAAEVTVIHPNDTGFELNQVTVMFIPAHFVRSIQVSYAGRRLFDAEMDFSVSENPTLRFNFVPHGPGELRAEVSDSRDAHFSGALQVG